MAEDRHVVRLERDRPHRDTAEGSHNRLSGTTVVCASLAGVAVGGPLLGMMGFTFLASVTLLLISSPLLIITSPLLLCGAVIIGVAMSGFALAAAMAVAGVSTLAWILRSFTGGGRKAGSSFEDVGGFKKLTAEEGKDWAGYLQQKAAQLNPTDQTRVPRG